MPRREWQLRVEDILDAIGRIERYTAGMTFETFVADDKTVDAVARNFAIIGEAVRYIPATVQRRYPRIPWAKMRAMRKVVIHQYPEVDLAVVWDTTQDDLRPLVPMLQEIAAGER